MSFSTLAELTRTHCANQGDRTAVSYTGDGRTWTYAALDREACCKVPA